MGGSARRAVQHRHVFRQGVGCVVLFYLGPLDAAAISLGSADATRLDFFLRNRPGEYLPGRRAARIFTHLIFLYLYLSQYAISPRETKSVSTRLGVREVVAGFNRFGNGKDIHA